MLTLASSSKNRNLMKTIHDASTTKCKKFDGHDNQCKEPTGDISFQRIHLERAIHLDVKTISDDEVGGLIVFRICYQHLCIDDFWEVGALGT